MSREDFTIKGDTQVLALLQALPRAVVGEGRKNVVSIAARKGLAVVAKQARSNLRTRHTAHYGLLGKAIGVKRGTKFTSGTNGERYLMYVRSKVYPQGNRKHKVNTNMIARFLEYGTTRNGRQAIAPRSWLRDAFQTTKNQAVEVADSELAKAVDDLAKEYLR